MYKMIKMIVLLLFAMPLMHTPLMAEPPSHAPWDALLKKYVSADGKVNYKGLKADKAKLDAYLAALSANPPEEDWSSKAEMAYWINAYNAYTVKLIIGKYPLKGIRELHEGNPWDVKWIKIGGKTYSLNNIEHDILRAQFKDARIHFAVNCAAKSCPPLLNKAWTADNLHATLEQQAVAFINNPRYNKIAGGNVQVSRIFEWYKEDFGDLAAYLNKYSKTKISANTKISFLEYDWSLNE